MWHPVRINLTSKSFKLASLNIIPCQGAYRDNGKNSDVRIIYVHMIEPDACTKKFIIKF